MHVVSHRYGNGIPSCIIPEEIKEHQRYIDVNGSFNTEVIYGDPECDGLLDVPVYDTNTVYLLMKTNISLN